MSPLARSKELYEERGYTVETVERWIPGANIRKDFLGCIDLIAMRPDPPDVVAIQSTSASNVSARVKKIADSAGLALMRALGWTVEVHGWGKRDNRWRVRVEDIS